VVGYHAAAFTQTFVGPVDSVTSTVFSRGYLGVDFFFVLSGFIIYHTNRNKTTVPGWSRRYAETRFVRIYLPYWPMGVALGFAYILMPDFSSVSRDWSWFATLTLLPSDRDTALIVAWTLRHELVFYAMFWLAFLTRYPVLILGSWAAAVVIAALMLPKLTPSGTYLIGLINIEFLFGMAVVYILKSRAPNWLFLAGFTLLLTLYIANGGLEQHRLIFAGALACLLVPFVRWEQAEHLYAPAFLILLGNASYAIYLVHNPLMALLVRWPPPSPALTFAWLCLAGTLAGLAYHLLFELRVIAFVRARLRKAAPGPTA